MKIRNSLLLVSLLLSASCTSLLNRALEKPTIELDHIDVKEASLAGATLLFYVKVQNPNSVELKVDEVRYQVFLNDKPFANAKTDEAVRVPAKASAVVPLPLPVHFQDLWSSLQEIFPAKSVKYKIEGDAKLSLFTVPFQQEGKVDF